MTINIASKISLPADLTNELDLFCNDIISLIKNDLCSIILYGGVAKAEYDDTSDINLMIVLKTINIDLLDKINPRIQKGILKFTLAPFIITEQDLVSSFNLFPIKFLDIKQNHIIIWGKDVLTPIAISEEFLKRNCQRELKNLALRLTSIYFHNYGFIENLGFRMKKIFPSFLISINALLYLKTGKSYPSKQAIIKNAIIDLGLDENVLNKYFDYKTGKIQLKNAEVKQLFSEFMILVRKVSSISDKL